MSLGNRGKKQEKIGKEKDTLGKACNSDIALLGERIRGQKNINHNEETDLKCTSHSVYLTEELDLPEKTQENKTKVHLAAAEKGFKGDCKRDLV